MIWAIWYSYSSEFVCFLFVRYTHMHMNFNFSVLVSVVNLRTFRSIRWNFLAAFTAMLGVWAVHVLQDCLYFMFSIWMLCCSLRIKIGTFGFLFFWSLTKTWSCFWVRFCYYKMGRKKRSPTIGLHFFRASFQTQMWTHFWVHVMVPIQKVVNSVCTSKEIWFHLIVVPYRCCFLWGFHCTVLISMFNAFSVGEFRHTNFIVI